MFVTLYLPRECHQLKLNQAEIRDTIALSGEMQRHEFSPK